MPPYRSLMFWSILSIAKRHHNVWVDAQRLRNLSRVVMIVLYLRWDDGLNFLMFIPRPKAATAEYRPRFDNYDVSIEQDQLNRDVIPLKSYTSSPTNINLRKCWIPGIVQPFWHHRVLWDPGRGTNCQRCSVQGQRDTARCRQKDAARCRGNHTN